MNRGPTYNQNNDFTFPSAFSDSISTISVNGSLSTPSSMVVAGCWDNTVSCFELQRSNTGGVANVVMQGQIRHDAPVLCSDIASDGLTTFSAGCDTQIRMWNVTQGSNPQAIQVIGKHDQPVSCMKFQPEKNVLITASWDKTVRLWDCRQPQPVQTIPVSDRVYCMDCKGDALVIGTADKAFHIYNLGNLGKPMAQYKSPLSYQLKTLSIFADKEGFAAGCIEGRVTIEYFSDMETRVRQSQTNANPSNKQPNMKSFAFKCHRVDSDVYSVNVVDFYKTNVLLTAGSDGTFSFWNKDVKLRINMYEQYKLKSPITCAKFTPIGDMMFYALSYDWSKGVSGITSPSQYPNTIIMHPIADQEMVNKK